MSTLFLNFFSFSFPHFINIQHLLTHCYYAQQYHVFLVHVAAKNFFEFFRFLLYFSVFFIIFSKKFFFIFILLFYIDCIFLRSNVIYVYN